MSKAKAKKTPERDVLKQILQWLRLQPACFVRRIQSGGIPKGNTGQFRRNPEGLGVSDIIGIWNGKPLAIEVKAIGNDVSAHQENFLANWTYHGGISIVAYSLNDVIKALREEDGHAHEAVIKIEGVLPK